jgi:predicted metal-dependent hydrolase
MKLRFEYGTEVIEFTVEYRKRKTLEIGIEPPANITVVAPIGATEEEIIKVVRTKAKWITQKLFEFREVEYRKRNIEYVNGESFMYLGRNYSLQIMVDNTIKKPEAKLYQGKFNVKSNTKDQNKIKAAMEEWYRQKTLDKVLDRVEYYNPYFRVSPNTIKVKEQKKRWASCNSKRDLLFNWRCSMAPAFVLDYIVVHELCHMEHLNHSTEFWNMVKRIMPDYENRKEWLKNNGIKLDL